MYQHGKRTTRPKDRKVFLQVAIVLGVAIIIGALVLQRDLYLGKQEKTSGAVVTQVSEAKKDVVKVDERLFYLELPSDWVFVRHNISKKQNSYEWRSTKKDGSDRRLLLHVDVIPESYKVVKLLPIRAEAEGFIPGNLSNDCIHFAKELGTENGTGNREVDAKWENVRFVCDPISANQTTGTGTEADGIGAKLGGHRFFFYFEDHNVRPDDQMLINIVKSFRVKS